MTDPDLAAARQRLHNLAQAEGVTVTDRHEPTSTAGADPQHVGFDVTIDSRTPLEIARDELARHKALAQEKIEAIRADRDAALEDLEEARDELARRSATAVRLEARIDALQEELDQTLAERDDYRGLVRAAVAAELDNRAHPPIPDPTGHVHAWDYWKPPRNEQP